MSRFYYKTRQVLQNEPFITKRGTTLDPGLITLNIKKVVNRKISLKKIKVFKLEK